MKVIHIEKHWTKGANDRPELTGTTVIEERKDGTTETTFYIPSEINAATIRGKEIELRAEKERRLSNQ